MLGVVRSGVQRGVAVQHQCSRFFGLSAAVASKIIYTETDEAPMLATYSLLPVIQRFAKPMGIEVEKRDISVAGRLIAHFGDYLEPHQRIPDELSYLGELAKTPEGNIIKLPNISASIPQLVECIEELQGKGYNVPHYNPNPNTAEEKEVYSRYAKVLGSAVNPVLREGNSDRRAAPPVKKHAQGIKRRSPQMRAWSTECRACVRHMDGGDFFGSEQSHIMPSAGNVKITLHPTSGAPVVLKESLALLEGEVIDASRISVKSLVEFFEKEITDSFESGLMLSLHMKATMMKVSDPIIFGHCVKVFFKDVFSKHAALFAELGVNANNGLGDVYEKIKGHASEAEVLADLAATYAKRPGLAMVDSDNGITNLHVPSDVIIDASMPNVVRDGGKMWNKDDKLEDVKCVIPDRCYADAYGVILEDCRKNGQFDWQTMGHNANVGLMAQKAEEYGSHDKTFQIAEAGKVIVTDSASGAVIFQHDVEVGDIWRMCQTKDVPIRDWVRLAVSRARATGAKAVFWLNQDRAHDANIIKLVNKYLPDHDTSGLDIAFAKPADAMQISCDRARAGLDTITCTGNVLRDYLTDLFPIIELGTSAKMLSVVPLLSGGVLLETGAGGSAPKHVQQFVKEGHLRWDSLGEYLATAIGFQELADRIKSENAKLLGDTLMDAVGKWLETDKSPGRKVKQIDNRLSNYYVALFWAEALAAKDPSWGALASKLAESEEQIKADLIECQGPAVDIGGYFKLDPVKADIAMRPSKIFNQLMDEY